MAFKSPVEAEIVDGKIHVWTNGFYPAYVNQMNSGAVPGARFRMEPEPHWRVPLDIDLAKRLRAVFGEDLTLGPGLKKWAKKTLRKNERLTGLALADTAELERLPRVLPKLYEAIHVGPRGLFLDEDEFQKALKEPPSYQAADVLYMATADHPMNCNQPGTGKTIETIASVYEAGLEAGPKLVVAPVTSLRTVWEDELATWQDQPAYVCPNGKAAREEWMDEMLQRAQAGEDFWALLNWQMIQYRNAWVRCPDHAKAVAAELRDCYECEHYLDSPYPQVFEIDWSVLVLDEFHKMGLGNPGTLTYKALRDLRSRKRIPLSGTPMGGKGIKMFGVLSFLFPDEFTSKWRFVDQWLTTDDSHWGRKIGDIKEGKEDEFYQMLSRYMIRRTKEEVLPWLPPKQYVPPKGIWVEMTGKQREQYLEFAEAAEIRIDEEQLSATSVLAEYTRLKQFAMAAQEIVGKDKDGQPILRPTTESCKLPVVYDLLEERGIRPGEDATGDEQVVIFSQFTQIVDMVADELQRKGYPAERLHGGTSKAKRDEVTRAFQGDGGVRVLVMNVAAGGVSITLDKASTVIFLDETWNPDDQEQAEDRVHRASRIHQVSIYYIRSLETIEQMIQERVLDKATINRDILDLRRMGLKATYGKKSR